MPRSAAVISMLCSPAALALTTPCFCFALTLPPRCFGSALALLALCLLLLLLLCCLCCCVYALSAINILFDVLRKVRHIYTTVKFVYFYRMREREREKQTVESIPLRCCFAFDRSLSLSLCKFSCVRYVIHNVSETYSHARTTLSLTHTELWLN